MAEVRAGLERVHSLIPGSGFASVTAGLTKPWGASLEAFVSGEVGFKPRENVDLFGFARADLAGVVAGLGARVTW